MDDVDENLHATLEVNLDQGVNERLKPEESENDHRIGNHLEGNNLEGNHLEGSHLEGNHLEGNNHQIQDHFHQEEMSEGSEVGINTITLLPHHHYDDDDDDDDVDDDEDEYDDDNYIDEDDEEDDQVGEGEGSVVSSVTDKYGFLAGDVLMLEVGSSSSS